MNSKELIGVAFTAGTGMIIGGIYQVANLFVNKHYNYTLTADTEAIVKDRSLMQVLYSLEKKFRHYDEITFDRIVDSIDRLCFHSNGVVESSQKEHNDDIISAKHFSMVKTNCREFSEIVKNNTTLEDLFEFENLLKQIKDKCENYVYAVIRKN